MSRPLRRPLALAITLLLPLLAQAQQGQAETPEPMPESEAKLKTIEGITVKGVPLRQQADDIVAPVVVLSGEELDARKANTLGETVSSIPGVTSSYFGPGVGRPVVRGLDGPRVAILSDGLGTSDVSNVSQDHAVAIEPFLADQIEVLKGPSTLLYGSGAIGGVVNAVDGRIHEEALQEPVGGRAELRYDAGSSGFTGMGRIDAGTDRYAIHADGVYRDNDDYDLAQGELANSAVATRTGALAGSVFGDWGFAGIAVSRYLNEYGNPAEPGDGVDPPVTIAMAQTRYEFKAGLFDALPGIERIRLSAAHGGYRHTEFEGDETGTVFLSSSEELRVEATHRRIGRWQGAFGLQAGRKQFEAIGEEAFVPSTRSRNFGLFLVEQAEWQRLKLELGARGDRQSSDPADGPGRSFSLASVSAGLRWKLAERWHLSLNLDRAQRAPAEEELYSNGPHLATAGFEIGDPGLAKETSRQVELGLHFHGKRIEAEFSAYRNRFQDFIYLAETGLTDPEFGLPVRQWTQAGASFRGLEAEATFHLAEGDAGRFDLRLYGDRVRATRDDGSSLPRIPAARLGLELDWERDAWRVRAGVVHTASQDDVDAFETRTDGYTLVNAGVAWNFRTTAAASWEAFLQGNNLGNQEARPATSVVKDRVPLPGRNISLGIRVFF